MAVSSQIAEALLEKAVGLQLDALLRRRRREHDEWWRGELRRRYPRPSKAWVRRFLLEEATERRYVELLGVAGARDRRISLQLEAAPEFPRPEAGGL